MQNKILCQMGCGVLAAALSVAMTMTVGAAQSFRDVPDGQWYTDAVEYCRELRLMNGTSATTFEPETTVDRAMGIQVLYNQAKTPPWAGTAPFADVAQGDWYWAAVNWGYSEKITAGVDPVRFGPEEPLTRQQVVKFLYEYAAWSFEDLSSNPDALTTYTDAGEIDAWAQEAFRWAVSCGIVSGVTATRLEPQRACTRAEYAQIIRNFNKWLVRPEQEIVPILIYHSVSTAPGASSGAVIEQSVLDEQLTAVRDAGYHTVTYQQLIDYVNNGAELPEKPIVVSFDDGYRDNLELAVPILERNGQCAVISVIGVTDGAEEYKDTGKPMTPHFFVTETAPYVESGVLELAGHTYDMHQVWGLDAEEGFREGVLRRPNESLEDYTAALTEDWQRSYELFDPLSSTPVFTYPYGKYSEESEKIFKDLGIQVTVTTTVGANCIRRGDPESLYLLKRLGSSEWSGEELLSHLEEVCTKAQFAKN